MNRMKNSNVFVKVISPGGLFLFDRFHNFLSWGCIIHLDSWDQPRATLSLCLDYSKVFVRKEYLSFCWHHLSTSCYLGIFLCILSESALLNICSKWDPGARGNRRFQDLKGLQIFSMLLLLEWTDSTPNAQLSAMKSLGSFSISDATN